MSKTKENYHNGIIDSANEDYWNDVAKEELKALNDDEAEIQKRKAQRIIEREEENSFYEGLEEFNAELEEKILNYEIGILVSF